MLCITTVDSGCGKIKPSSPTLIRAVIVPGVESSREQISICLCNPAYQMAVRKQFGRPDSSPVDYISICMWYSRLRATARNR